MNYIQSNKFSDTSVSIRTLLPLDKKTITALNVLVYMMQTKTEKYASKQVLVSSLNNAYGTKLSFGLTSYGKQVMINMRVQYIRTDWIDDENYVEMVRSLIDEVLFHSILDESSFEEAKYLLKTRLERMIDDPDSLSIYKLFETLDTDHEISIPVQGSLSALDMLTLSDVSKVYEMYRNGNKYVYVCGMLDDVLKGYFESISSCDSFTSKHSLLVADKASVHTFSRDISQSSIAQLYTTNIEFTSKDYYALLLMNSILGQSPTSLLFEEVREKHSLCYSIHSSLIRFDGALIIQLGTKKENIDKALSLIQEQISRIVSLDFDVELLEIARKDCIDGLIVGQDQPFSLIETAFLNDLLNRNLNLEDKIELLNQVQIEDVQRVASNLALAQTVIVEEESYEI